MASSMPFLPQLQQNLQRQIAAPAVEKQQNNVIAQPRGRRLRGGNLTKETAPGLQGGWGNPGQVVAGGGGAPETGGNIGLLGGNMTPGLPGQGTLPGVFQPPNGGPFGGMFPRDPSGGHEPGGFVGPGRGGPIEKMMPGGGAMNPGGVVPPFNLGDVRKRLLGAGGWGGGGVGPGNMVTNRPDMGGFRGF